MLHSVPLGVGQIVGKKRVGMAFVRRQLSVDCRLLADDVLDIPGEEIGFTVGTIMMHRHPERFLVHLERSHHKVAEFGWTVDEI